jgi:hypothetical protein
VRGFDPVSAGYSRLDDHAEETVGCDMDDGEYDDEDDEEEAPPATVAGSLAAVDGVLDMLDQPDGVDAAVVWGLPYLDCVRCGTGICSLVRPLSLSLSCLLVISYPTVLDRCALFRQSREGSRQCCCRSQGTR